MKFAKTITAALIATATLSAPAMAGGQFSFSYLPSKAEHQQALGAGLQIYSLVKGLSSKGANVSQNGNNNAAGFNQNGYGNNGLIVQEGNGHQGQVQQYGNGNNCGLFQFGKNSQGQCAQYGNGQSSITTVFGF
ncbi:MAG: curlin [Candidatus Devosia phytovorans]|uniref:Curlin n=1 Tax=Candidatus Devosia phytovorans TaxID=3121372 RepID=A0AAJ6B2H2_9HYPH|nr:curlin [Devosia sp.]WEK05543.1 MAG: curlin [Devosia sp.]